PFRAALTGLNLTLGVMGIIFGLTLNSTLTAYIQNPALLGIVYDALVTRQETGHHRTERLLTTAPGVEAFYSQFVTGVKTPTGESFEIKAVAGDLTPFPFIIAQGRMFEPGTNEAIAGRGLLGWLGLRVGDELTVLVDDKPVTWRIVGQYPEPVNAGQMLMVSLPALAHTLRHASPTTYYLKLTPGASPEQLKRYLEPGPEADLNLTLVGDAIPDSIAYLQLGIFTLAAILIGIALVNVFNTSLQTVQEKLRVIGILKTVGMTPGQVVAMVVTAAAMLGLLAAALGIPLGWLATRWSLQAFAESYGFGQVAATLNYLYAALLLPLVVLVSMASSLIPGRRAAKAAIVSVLRHE
ncbi:MAG: ABC transporter permease, partial [Anaerolineae bacterium]